eukprot:1812151-Pyramimonas_sp.AAC.1
MNLRRTEMRMAHTACLLSTCRRGAHEQTGAVNTLPSVFRQAHSPVSVQFAQRVLPPAWTLMIHVTRWIGLMFVGTRGWHGCYIISMLDVLLQ